MDPQLPSILDALDLVQLACAKELEWPSQLSRGFSPVIKGFPIFEYRTSKPSEIFDIPDDLDLGPSIFTSNNNEGGLLLDNHEHRLGWEGLDLAHPHSASDTVGPEVFMEPHGVVPTPYLQAPRTSSTPQQLTYEPLDTSKLEVRMLALLPGQLESPIECRFIRRVSLLDYDIEPYEALSYCWGDPNVRKSILLHDHEFNVTLNLESALRQLRHPTNFRLLWIDAICIDQHNLSERASQVQIMRHIYQKAFGTLIYVGAEDENTDLVIDMGHRMSSLVEVLTGVDAYRLWGEKLLNLVVSQLTKVFEVFESSLDADTLALLQKSLQMLFQRDWFRRVWVIQEVYNGKTVTFHWGHRAMPWGPILLLDLWLKRYSSSTWHQLELDDHHIEVLTRKTSLPRLWMSAATRRIDSSFQPGARNHYVWNMEDLLFSARAFNASENHDKIYALFAMITLTFTVKDPAKTLHNLQRLHPGLLADYTRPVQIVFAEFTRSLVQFSKSLCILSPAGRMVADGKRRNPTGCPSWVPDLLGTFSPAAFPITYAQTSEIQVLLWYWVRGSVLGNLTTFVDHSTPWHILRLQGHLVDVVDRVPNLMVDGTIHTLVFRQPYRSPSIQIGFGIPTDALLYIWQRFVVDLEQYPNGEDLLEAFLSTLVAGRFDFIIGSEKSPDKHPSQSFLADFAAYWDLVDPGLTALPEKHRAPLLASKHAGLPRRFSSRMQVAFGRGVLLTAAGYIGLCPPGTQQGDQIAVFTVPWCKAAMCYSAGVDSP
jgi:hypothetical protein